MVSLLFCRDQLHFIHVTFSVCVSQLWQGRWQGNEIVVKVLKVRDWTTRKSRDFNEEYPKLRLLLSPDSSTASLSCAVVVTHLSVCIVLNQTLCIISFWGVVASHVICLFMSNPLWVCLFLSVCLSLSPSFPPSLPPSGYIPGYFPTRMSYPCWEHVSLLPPLTPSSSHTGCLMAPSTTCCMKAPVSTSTLVTKSVLVTTLVVVRKDL